MTDDLDPPETFALIDREWWSKALRNGTVYALVQRAYGKGPGRVEVELHAGEPGGEAYMTPRTYPSLEAARQSLAGRGYGKLP